MVYCLFVPSLISFLSGFWHMFLLSKEFSFKLPCKAGSPATKFQLLFVLESFYFFFTVTGYIHRVQNFWLVFFSQLFIKGQFRYPYPHWFPQTLLWFSGFICLSLAFGDIQFSSVQSLSCVWLFATPWTTAHQASLYITNSRSLLKLMSIGSVMPSNHLILCYPLSSCIQSFPASGSFLKSQFFTSGGQSIGASVSSSVLPMNRNILFTGDIREIEGSLVQASDLLGHCPDSVPACKHRKSGSTSCKKGSGSWNLLSPWGSGQYHPAPGVQSEKTAL